MTTDTHEIAWLAGLLEGEGCFGFSKGTPTLYLLMTDKDVIDKAAKLMSATHVGVMTRRTQTHFKAKYQISRFGLNAVSVMRAILPYMGTRRSEKIISVLSQYRKKVA